MGFIHDQGIKLIGFCIDIRAGTFEKVIDPSFSYLQSACSDKKNSL